LNKFLYNFEHSDPKTRKNSNFARCNNVKREYGLDTRVQQTLRVLPRHHRRGHARTPQVPQRTVGVGLRSRPQIPAGAEGVHRGAPEIPAHLLGRCSARPVLPHGFGSQW